MCSHSCSGQDSFGGLLHGLYLRKGEGGQAGRRVNRRGGGGQCNWNNVCLLLHLIPIFVSGNGANFSGLVVVVSDNFLLHFVILNKFCCHFFIKTIK